MIIVSRTAEPAPLTTNQVKWLADYLAARKKYNTSKTKTNRAALDKAENKYNNKAIKTALINMCHGKCVYCESHISHVSYPHIEHYKPKSKYPKLCFEWTNLFLGCSVCNGKSYKSDKFPTASKGGPIVDPETENPFDFFDFQFDAKTGVSLVKAKTKNGRAKTTETVLGLNRIDLLKHRNSVVKKLAFFAIKASKGDVDALDELKDSMKPTEEYSAFAIAFFKKFKLK